MNKKTTPTDGCLMQYDDAILSCWFKQPVDPTVIIIFIVRFSEVFIKVLMSQCLAFVVTHKKDVPYQFHCTSKVAHSYHSMIALKQRNTLNNI